LGGVRPHSKRGGDNASQRIVHTLLDDVERVPPDRAARATFLARARAILRREAAAFLGFRTDPPFRPKAMASRGTEARSPGERLNAKIVPLRRYLGTPNVSRHRLFVWLPPEVLADHQLIAFATDDDYMFGILHSRVHETWARAKGSQLREAESASPRMSRPRGCTTTATISATSFSAPPSDRLRD
jgi:hypothetical protein